MPVYLIKDEDDGAIVEAKGICSAIEVWRADTKKLIAAGACDPDYPEENTEQLHSRDHILS